MALSITFTGRPIVAGERDRSITFTDLGLDWAGAGYTLWLQIVAPDTTCTIVSLVAVGGHTDQAKLSSVTGLFPTSGMYVLKIFARDGSGHTENLASVDYYMFVYP